MTAVRHTPKRKRMTCPSCGKDSAYTHPWVPNTSGFGSDHLMRDYDRRILTAHRDPQTKVPCPSGGGFGIYVPRGRS